MKMQRNRNIILIAVFLVSIAAPLLAMVFRLDRSNPLRENRKRAAFPSITLDRGSLKQFPHDFYVYFRDNFGFRDAFIRLNFRVRRTLLQEAEFNDVLFGNDGWL